MADDTPGLKDSFIGMRIRISPQSEDVMRRIMKKYSLTNFSEAIEYLCGFHEGKDK